MVPAGTQTLVCLYYGVQAPKKQLLTNNDLADFQMIVQNISNSMPYPYTFFS